MAGNLTKRKILYKFISIIDEITIKKGKITHADFKKECHMYP
jgi:hypothetical protein